MSSRAFLKKAFGAFQDGDYSEAEARCQSALTKDPNSYDAYLLLGKCAFMRGALHEAEEHYYKATELNAKALPAWQGLTELFESSPTEARKALAPLHRIVELTESGAPANAEKLLQLQLRLAELLKRVNEREDAEKAFQKALIFDMKEDQKLEILCLLADLQLLDYDRAIEDRLERTCHSLGCHIHHKEECEYDSILNRVHGEYAEEALEADSELGSTLKEIIQRSLSCGVYKKFHDFYLQMFCKAVYCASPRSAQRYNLRLQALEMCYKMIFGISTSIKGLCTSPFPYLTALRLLEINEEIIGVKKTPNMQKLDAITMSPKEVKTPNMFKSESEPTLNDLPPSITSPSARSKPIKVTIAGKRTGHEGSGHGINLVSKRSLERRKSFDGHRSSFRLSISPKGGILSSPTISLSPYSVGGGSHLMPALFEGPESTLPKFMRSSSLSCVRKLHRLDSGFLKGGSEIIDLNSPFVAEISESVGRKLAHIIPWHPESKIQMVLAIRRKEKSIRIPNTDPSLTNLDSLERNEISGERNLIHIQLLEKGIASGTRLFSPRVVLIELLMENEQFNKALKFCEEALTWIEHHAKAGGYPRTQAVITFKLHQAQCHLKLKNYHESESIFKELAENVSEGEIAIGAVAGCQPLSIRQAAQRGLAHLALAQGDRSLALRRYEQMMGAGLLGKSPLEYWAAAEYGYMLFEDGDTIQAKQYLEKALDILDKVNLHEVDSIRAEYNFKLGQVYWSLGGKWRKSHQYLFSALQSACVVDGPYQAAAYSLLGQYYKEVEENVIKAEECWNKAINLNPEQQEFAGFALFSLMKELGRSKIDQKSLCLKYIALGCHASWLFHCQGDLHLQEESYQAAIGAYQKALKAKSNRPELWEKLGTAHLKMKRFTSAQKSFSRALDLEPKRLYPLLRLGDCFFQLEDYPSAINAYRHALELDSNAVVVRSSLAACLLTSSKQKHRVGAIGVAAEEVAEAKDLIQQAYATHQYPQVLCKQLGDVLLWKSQILPLETSKKLQEAKSSPQELISLIEGAQEQQENELKEAIRCYGKLLRLYPYHSKSWGDFVSIQISSQTTSNKKDLEKLVIGGLSLDPSSAELWSLLGCTSTVPESKQAALSIALKLDPTQIKAYVDLATLYKDCEHQELAQEALIHARSHDPSSPLIWQSKDPHFVTANDLWVAMGRMEGDIKQAYEYYVHSVELGAGSIASVQLVSLVGSVQFTPEIYNAIQSLIFVFPMDPSVWNAYGLMMENRGNYDKSIFAFQMSVALLERAGNDTEAVILNLCRVGWKSNCPDLILKVLNHSVCTEALFFQAFAYSKTGRTEDAKDCLAKVMAQADNVDVLLEVGKLYLSMMEPGIHGFDGKEFLNKLSAQIIAKPNHRQSQDMSEVCNLYLANCFGQEGEASKNQIKELRTKLGCSYTMKAAHNYITYLRTKEVNQLDAIMTALHWTPWNRDYCVTYNLNVLQTLMCRGIHGGGENRHPWSIEMLGPLLHPSEEALDLINLWICALKAWSSPIEDSAELCKVLEKRIKKVIRMNCQSVIGWFLLTVVLARLRQAAPQQALFVKGGTYEKVQSFAMECINRVKGGNEILKAMKSFMEREITRRKSC